MVVTSSRAAAIRYKKAFDRYIEQHSEYGFIHSLVAFSGKMTGKQVMHQDDSEFKDDVFIVDENEIHRAEHEPGCPRAGFALCL
jgi:type I restriction enzyme R subunit